ncbi:MAG: PDR/VanB family oxidoreductase [Pseudomonadota bacterium]
MPETISARVTARRDLTPAIREFVLAPAPGFTLPAAEPGAHIGVETPSGAWRQYSLVTPAQEPACYRIAVKRETDGRGGSDAVHTGWAEGSEILLTAPSNSFALQAAPRYLLIAGGIGVTPIYAMAQQLVGQGADLEMIYCTRSRAETAYADALEALLGDRLTLHHDGGDPEEVYDFWDHFAEPQMAHVYCCGPSALMEEIKAISGHWPEGRVHFEDFAGVEGLRADDVAFDVALQKTGLTVSIPADRSILEALRAAGISTPSSCESGTCGTCKVGLIAGAVDHRDMVLMEHEKADHIMICVSRAASGGLVLDL